jgi:hypothetical protein
MKRYNFKDLVLVAEADAPKPKIKSVKPPTGGVLKTAAKVAGKNLANLGKQVIFDPKGLANKLDQFGTIHGTMAAAVAGAKGFKKEVQGQRQADLEKYYQKLAVPNGWPKTGDQIKMLTMYYGDYIGKITNTQNVGNKEVAYTIMANPAPGNDGQPNLAMVMTVDQSQLPYYSVRKYIVSNVTPEGKYIKNEKESGHNPSFLFNFETGAFEIDSKARPDTDYIPVASVSGVRKVGDTITGEGIQTGEEVTGEIVGVVERNMGAAKVQLYKVKFIPKAAATP